MHISFFIVELLAAIHKLYNVCYHKTFILWILLPNFFTQSKQLWLLMKKFKIKCS